MSTRACVRVCVCACVRACVRVYKPMLSVDTLPNKDEGYLVSLSGFKTIDRPASGVHVHVRVHFPIKHHRVRGDVLTKNCHFYVGLS